MRERNIFLNCFILVSLVTSLWIQTSDACGGVLNSSKGIIKSPNFPNNYPPHTDCVWNIVAPPESRIMLNFTHFDLEDDIDCSYDRVKVFGGPSQYWRWSRQDTYCGSELPPVFVSEGNALEIRFRSDVSEEKSGFLVLYSTDGDIENIDEVKYSADVALEATAEWDTTETLLYSAETDWYSSETQSITSLPYSPLTHPVSGPEVSNVKPTAGFYDKTRSSQRNSNTVLAMLPLSNSQFSREISPISSTARDPKYTPASPRNYFDISINFPFGQRWPEPDTLPPIDRKPTQNQGMGFIPVFSKGKQFSSQFEQDYDRFSVDTQDQNVKNSDEELSSRYVVSSYSQNDYVLRPMMALFLFSNSHPINIRVNG